MLKSMLIAGAGGFCGTALRYLVGVLARTAFPGEFPLGTFLVNTAGCLLIGLILGLAERTNALTGNHVLLLATGFCGGFTTFSAFANEALVLGTKGAWTMSALYLVGSIVAGIAAVWAGRAIAL